MKEVGSDHSKVNQKSKNQTRERSEAYRTATVEAVSGSGLNVLDLATSSNMPELEAVQLLLPIMRKLRMVLEDATTTTFMRWRPT